nr:hypothetical protein [uncultured Bacillus sp.]
MESQGQMHGENMKLLKEIFNLKKILNDMYAKKGPNSSDYINLSIKLNVLEKKYMEEKLMMYQNELVDPRKQQEMTYSNHKGHFHKREMSTVKQQKSLVWHAFVIR